MKRLYNYMETKQVNVLLPVATYDELKRRAFELASEEPGRNVTVSEVVRLAVDLFLKKGGK